MDTLTALYERLAAGEYVPMRDGKRARPTGPAVACPKCKGGGTVVEEQPAAALFRYLEAHCSECWGTGKHVPFVIEADPMMLKPWVGTLRGGLAERFTVTHARVAFVENDRGEISVGIDTDTKRVTIDLRACKGARQRKADALALTWDIAIRLADAELRALGYRET